MNENFLPSCLLQKIKSSPVTPGVYKFLGKDRVVLYIGKATNLAKRLSTYARGSAHSRKATKMLALAQDVIWTSCTNEVEALLLEAQEIKHIKPPYNTLLKDDKSFYNIVLDGATPSIKLQRERKIIKPSGLTFGPFVKAGDAKKLIEIIQSLFLVRDCSSAIFSSCSKNNRPCLQYHIKRCSAPCAPSISKVTKQDYAKQVASTISFLKGDTKSIISQLSKAMQESSNKMEFELAKSYLGKIRFIKEILAEYSTNFEKNCDIAILEKHNNIFCLSITFIRSGINTGSTELAARQNFNDLGLEDALIQFYQNHNKPPLLMVQKSIPKKTRDTLEIALNCKVVTPKNKLEESAMNNMHAAAQNMAINSHGLIITRNKALERLPQIFNFPNQTFNRIEIFDNSHLFGTNPVGAMVVYQNGDFAKSEYRTFGFAKNEGDDYKMMEEMLTRRLNNNKNKPDLWLIDGGDGHRSVVLKVMKKTGVFVPFICISKGVERNAGKEKFWTQDKEINSLDNDIEVLRFLQFLRDEAHRFAISTHRRRRISNIGSSVLDNIKGIGKAKKALLLSVFGSTEKIFTATEEELTRVPGITLHLAKSIKTHHN